MKKISIILSAILLTGCSQKLSMDYSSLDLKIELDKSQYEIVGNIKGVASSSWLWLYFPIPLKRTKEYGHIYGLYYKNTTAQNAIYNAIANSYNDIDYIVAPKFYIKYSGFPPFLWKTTVTVVGKGVKLKEG